MIKFMLKDFYLFRKEISLFMLYFIFVQFVYLFFNIIQKYNAFLVFEWDYVKEFFFYIGIIFIILINFLFIRKENIYLSFTYPFKRKTIYQMKCITSLLITFTLFIINLITYYTGIILFMFADLPSLNTFIQYLIQYGTVYYFRDLFMFSMIIVSFLLLSHQFYLVSQFIQSFSINKKIMIQIGLIFSYVLLLMIFSTIEERIFGFVYENELNGFYYLLLNSVYLMLFGIFYMINEKIAERMSL